MVERIAEQRVGEQTVTWSPSADRCPPLAGTSLFAQREQRITTRGGSGSALHVPACRGTKYVPSTCLASATRLDARRRVPAGWLCVDRFTVERDAVAAESVRSRAAAVGTAGQGRNGRLVRAVLVMWVLLLPAAVSLSGCQSVGRSALTGRGAPASDSQVAAADAPQQTSTAKEAETPADRADEGNLAADKESGFWSGWLGRLGPQQRIPLPRTDLEAVAPASAESTPRLEQAVP